MAVDREEALRLEYQEVSSNFRLLTDIRFKLLAFLPITAGAAAALTPETARSSTLAISVFGFVVTIALVMYNTRNDQLYDALVDRAAEIERSLGVPDGAFAHRVRSWFQPGLGTWRWKVDHRTAVATIYCASIALWLLGVFDSAAQLMYAGFSDESAPWWVHITPLVAAVVLTDTGRRLVKRQRKQAKCLMSIQAAKAVRAAQGQAQSELATNPRLLSLCEELADPEDRVNVRSRARFLSDLEPGQIAHYVSDDSPERRGAQIVALLTDLAPESLQDCTSGRRELHSLRLCQELLADRLQTLGPGHQDTLTARSELAAVTGELGEAARAIQLCEELLADRIRLLGPDHPDTLATRLHLAYWTSVFADRHPGKL